MSENNSQSAAFKDAPEELDVTITEQASQQAADIARASAALTDEVSLSHQASNSSDTSSNPNVL